MTKRKQRVDVTVEIGERLARHVFKAGSVTGSKVSRIAFKTGTWTPDGSGERERGGLCEAALASVLMEGLQEIFGGGEKSREVAHGD